MLPIMRRTSKSGSRPHGWLLSGGPFTVPGLQPVCHLFQPRVAVLGALRAGCPLGSALGFSCSGRCPFFMDPPSFLQLMFLYKKHIPATFFEMAAWSPTTPVTWLCHHPLLCLHSSVFPQDLSRSWSALLELGHLTHGPVPKAPLHRADLKI